MKGVLSVQEYYAHNLLFNEFRELIIIDTWYLHTIYIKNKKINIIYILSSLFGPTS